jgi:hypothetical protein
LGDQAVVELQGMIRPVEDLALYQADMADWDGPGAVGGWRKANRGWVAANNGCRLDIPTRTPTAATPDASNSRSDDGGDAHGCLGQLSGVVMTGGGFWICMPRRWY